MQRERPRVSDIIQASDLSYQHVFDSCVSHSAVLAQLESSQQWGDEQVFGFLLSCCGIFLCV